MFGREVNLPCDVLFPRPQPEEPRESHEYVANLRHKMEECYEIARQTLKVYAERQKRDYDTRVAENQYKPGDLVDKRHPINKKLEIPWDGPFVVTEIKGKALYKIANKKRQMVVHHDLLKPCTSREIPKWVDSLREKLGGQ
jgi:hypothetical protein